MTIAKGGVQISTARVAFALVTAPLINSHGWCVWLGRTAGPAEAFAARESGNQFLRDLCRRAIAIPRILGQTTLHDRIERSNLNRLSRANDTRCAAAS